MADTTTTNLELVKPEIGASNNTWGDKYNFNMDEIDAAFGDVYDYLDKRLRVDAPQSFSAAEKKQAITNIGVDSKAVFVTKSAGYTAVAGDNNTFYEFTATATLGLTAAATLAADWHMMVFANGGDVTVDPNGSELINGAAALAIANGDAAYIICTGSAFKAIAIPSKSLQERIKFLATGATLPTEDIGPIWHTDYASIMTWQKFDANGAAYEGYASAEIGMPVLDGRSTPRTGYLKRNGASLSKTTHAALWGWAQHNGRVVTLGSWAAGAFVFADNGDGTFKVPDNRAEFERAWDDGRGIDSGRTFGSSQLDAFQGHKHNQRVSATSGTTAGEFTRGVGTSDDRAGLTDTGVPKTDGANGTPRTAAETRSRNVALLACIKF